MHLITLDNAIIALNDHTPECVDYCMQLNWSCSDVTCMCLLFLVCLLCMQELAVFVTGLATDIIAELDEVGGDFVVCTQSVVCNQCITSFCVSVCLI